MEIVAGLTWTFEAVESLRDIYGHIALDRPRTAERTIESIVNKVASLSAAPRSGQRYPYAGNRDVFVLTYGHFRIAYSVDSARELPRESAQDDVREDRKVKDAVTVLGVFHGLIFLPKR